MATRASQTAESASALLERERELQEIGDAIDAAIAGRGSLLSVEGPAGAGKTRLLERAGEIACDRKVSVLRARGGELERGFGFGVARQLFEGAVTTLPAPERAQVLEGAAGLAAPLVGLEPPNAGPTPGAAPDPAFAATHGLYWLTANLASREPLMLLVDDAQWSDRSSLRFLAYLARRLEEIPVIGVLGVRTGEPLAPIELLDTIGDDGVRLVPGPLSPAAASALVESWLGPGEGGFATACHEASGGNPLLLTALLADLRSKGVEPSRDAIELVRRIGGAAISEATVSRLRSLPREAVELAKAVAVLGTDAELHDAGQLAELEVTEAAAAADQLALTQILKPDRPLEFVHPLVRTAIYESVPIGERSGAHGRAALILEQRGANADAVALQLLSAEPGTVPDAAAKLEAAARRALDRGAPEIAVSCLKRGLREPGDPELRARLLHLLGSTGLRIGDPESIDQLREARELTAPGAARAAVARELSLGLVPGGRYADAIRVLEETIEELGEADRELRLMIEAEIGTEAMLSAPTVPAAIERLIPRLDEVREARTPGERAALATISILQAGGEADADEVAENARRAIRGGLVEDQGADAHVVYNGPYPLCVADAFDEAKSALNTALAESQRRGSLLGAARAYAFRSNLAYRRGALADAQADAEASMDAATPMWVVRQMATGWLIEALIERGELERARAELESAELNGELIDILMHNFPLASRAKLRIACGEFEKAVADLVELERREGTTRGRNPAWFGQRSLMSEALLQLGDTDAARELAAEELRLAKRFGARRAIGVAQRACGLAEGGEKGSELLRGSVATFDGSGAWLEHARALVDLGAALRRGGSRRSARGPLADGMEMAHRCGAAPLAERAREELIATGARPRRMVRTGPEALTPSELRAARMAAEGLTNRQIAQALFVTVRTIEVHLTSAYRKLDIASREELATALAH